MCTRLPSYYPHHHHAVIKRCFHGCTADAGPNFEWSLLPVVPGQASVFKPLITPWYTHNASFYKHIRTHTHAYTTCIHTRACMENERERERSNLPGPAAHSAGRLPGRRIRPFGHQLTQHRERCRPWRYHAPSIAVKYSIQRFLNSNQKNSNLIPKFSTDLISTLANLQSDDLSELMSKYGNLTREERTYRGIVLAPSTMVV